MTDWRMLVAAAARVAATAAASAVEHLVFPVPGHPDYSQNLRWRTFELRQENPRAFSYSYRVKVSGLPADTPESNSNVGMTVCVTYDDGTKKWTEPADRPSPVKLGWQDVSGVFQPVRAVSNVTLYVRIARPGEAWFDDVRLEELKPAERHGPCRMREAGGRYLLENDFVSIAVDPAAVNGHVSQDVGGRRRRHRQDPVGAADFSAAYVDRRSQHPDRGQFIHQQADCRHVRNSVHAAHFVKMYRPPGRPA